VSDSDAKGESGSSIAKDQHDPLERLNVSDSARGIDPADGWGNRERRGLLGDRLFFLIMGGLSASFLMLVILLVVADLLFTSPADFVAALQKPEIRSAFRLTMLSCTFAAILSLWVATPLGYLLSRFQFRGRAIIDTIVDIPIVLPPLVLGISLLILFHQPFPFSNWFGDGAGLILDDWLFDNLGTRISFRWPAVVLAQFSVSCAFAIRTMRVTFDQIDSRAEDVARTLGCNQAEAFLKVTLPQSWRGMIAAFTIAWARALGEFGPILVFAGATRFRTEVLSTSVFLELSVGQLDAAVAVSLLMVAMAVVVLVLLRWIGAGLMR
jgi:molybdate transport system permease protein